MSFRGNTREVFPRRSFAYSTAVHTEISGNIMLPVSTNNHSFNKCCIFAI